MSWLNIAVFLGAHIPLALLMYKVNMIATAHAMVTVGVALSWAVVRRKRVKVAYAAAYIAGAEVLWRMTEARIFWESGKYATIAIFAAALLQYPRWKHRPLPVLFFVLLMPSVFLTLAQVDFIQAQNHLSFNLSGPLALATSAFFFSNLKLSRQQLQKMFVYLMGPAVGIVSIAIYSTVTATKIVFTSESNFVTSGGYGPNQVASILGLAALFAFIYAMDSGVDRKTKLLLFGALVVFLAQSAMTFSRGGLYNAAGAAILACFYLFRTRRLRGRLILGMVLFFPLAYFVVLPLLDNFTGGALLVRFQDAQPTGRDTLMLQEFELWQQNPLFGVGPGLALSSRMFHSHALAAHTEFSRLIAEHGTFGFVAILLLGAIGAQNLRRARTAMHKALVAAMLVWSCLYMLNAAMRLVAPSFAFGLASVILLDRRVLNRRTRVGAAQAYRGPMPLFPPNKGKNALAH